MPGTEILSDTSDMRFPHGMFRKAFADVDRVVGVAGDDPARAAAVATFYGEVLAFLKAHHGAEDALLWPLLRERRIDEQALLDRMESQHGGIEELCAAAGRACGAYAGAPGEATARTLADAVHRLATELGLHFTEEEREILPLAARTVTQDEWGAMPGWAMSHFLGRHRWLVLGLIFEQMTEAEQEVTLAHVPDAMREMWRTTGARDFEAFVNGLRGTEPATA